MDGNSCFLQGGIEHKNLWLIDLKTRAERQLTNVPPDFEIRDYDISPDGSEVVLERVQERSDVGLLGPSETEKNALTLRKWIVYEREHHLILEIIFDAQHKIPGQFDNPFDVSV